jgi:hypothetical protein
MEVRQHRLTGDQDDANAEKCREQHSHHNICSV